MNECPKCHTPGAYVGFHMHVECVNLYCEFFSTRRYRERIEELQAAMDRVQADDTGLWRRVNGPIVPDSLIGDITLSLIDPSILKPPGNTP